MKIGLFTDCHYTGVADVGGGRLASLSYEKVRLSMEQFKRENVDLVFCLGDLTDVSQTDTHDDVAKNLEDITSLIYSYGIPFYLVPGNHDYLCLKGPEIEKVGKLKLPPYKVSYENYDFILLDANFRGNMKRFDETEIIWYDSNLPPDQVDFLKQELTSSNKKCVVLVHENLDPSLEESHIIKNADEIRDIITKSGKVVLVLQGHFHGGNEITVDGIPYVTVPGMCVHEDGYYKIITLE